MKNPVPPPPSGVQKNIVVAGAGLTGLYTALRLVQAGHKVAVVDAGPAGNGSSSRSAACHRQQFSTPSTVRGMRFAVKSFDNLEEITGVSLNPGEQLIIHQGYLFLYDYRARAEKLVAQVEMQKQAGLKEVELLYPEDLNKRFSFVNSRGLTCATWCPTDGFLLPVVIMGMLKEACERLGVMFVLNAEITGVRRENGKIVSIYTAKGDITGDLFVNATNAWAPGVSRLLGGTILPIKAHRRYLYFSEGLASDNELMTVADFKRMPFTITPNPNFIFLSSIHREAFAK